MDYNPESKSIHDDDDDDVSSPSSIVDWFVIAYEILDVMSSFKKQSTQSPDTSNIFQDLNKRATIPWNPDISLKTWCNSADKLYAQVLLDQETKDYENSYIHGMKFLRYIRW